MVQGPIATGVTVVPETVHVADVNEAKVTARPELAVALTVNFPALNARFGGGAVGARYVVAADGCGEHKFSTTSAQFERDAAAYRAAVKKNGTASIATDVIGCHSVTACITELSKNIVW